MDIRVPRLGEGVSSGTVVNVLVKPGDNVKKDQTILELETEKAVAPIPASEGGVVDKILVKEGDVVAVGQAVISIKGGGGQAPAAAAQPAQQQQAAPAPQPSMPPPAQHHAGQPQSWDYTYQSPSGFPPPASPSVRKVAEELGIDLRHVRGSESGGRIVMGDLRNYIQQLQQMAQQGRGAAPAPAAAKPAAPPVDFSKWGKVTRKPVSNLRKTIGQKMAEAWTTVPHVTQFDEADITSLLEMRKKYVAAYEKKGVKLTVTSFILRAVVQALQKQPVFNASLDESSNELVYKEYVNLGVAVDTEAGLIVPVIRDCHKKSMLEMSKELAALAEKTRARKISVDEIQGGSFNVSNLGGIGGTFFTPIVSPPQVAVLGIGRGVLRPVVKQPAGNKGAKTAGAPKIEPASMLPLGLSYDHRVIDGADGARFIRELIGCLENFNEKDVKI